MSSTHTIVSGDSIANIAYAAGLLVQTVWDDAGNQALRERRSNMNMLMPGDVLVIPDKRLQTLAATTDQRHRFRLKGVPHVFKLQLYEDDEPRAHQAYTLTVQGPEPARTLSGTTDADGVLTAYIPPGAVSARLVIEPTADSEGLELDVLLGTLEPLEELSGVQKRLANLGFDCPLDGQPSAQTTQAIAAFQQQLGLPATGTVDAATRARLGAMNDELGDFPEPPATPD